MIFEKIKKALIPPAFQTSAKAVKRSAVKNIRTPQKKNKNHPEKEGISIFKKILLALMPPRFQAAAEKQTLPAAPSMGRVKKEFKTPVAKMTEATFGIPQVVLLLLAFGFAAKGQLEWLQVSENRTLGFGAIYYLLGIVCFLLVFRPFRGDWVASKSMPKGLEVSLLAAVLGVAAFFRIYRLDAMPPGVFWDQGYEGLYALKILHEHFRPVMEFFEFKNPALLLYQLAGWFVFFTPNQEHLYLFFALLSLATFPFVYWTFRQLAGPRTALLALYILAVMRWNINFSRNGFPTIQVPFYLFGSLSFLIHGLRTGKKWAFWVSAFIYSLGCYTYQAYKITPLLLFAYLAYEFYTNRENFRAQFKNLAAFFLIVFVMVIPILHEYFGKTGFGLWREQNYNIFSEMREKQSWKPLWEMVSKTALMFNRSGDINERHNYPNYRMLDDITGVFFILGLAFALSRFRQKIFYFGAGGFFIMCLPCLLSIDPAHANRMLGTTPFIALLAAFPLAAVMDRVGKKWGVGGELACVLLLIQPFLVMAELNYHNYFVLQASNNSLYDIGIWNGYSVADTRIGEMIQKDGPLNDFYLAPRFYDYPTIQYFQYFHPEYSKKFEFPKDVPPFQTGSGRGIIFCLVGLHTGEFEFLKDTYPNGQLSKIKDLQGNTLANIYKVGAEDLSRARGLRIGEGVGGKIFDDFPNDLPTGPRLLALSGNVFIEDTGKYRFKADGNCRTNCEIGGHKFVGDKEVSLARGFYSIELSMRLPKGKADPRLSLMNEKGLLLPLDSNDLTPLRLNHGLEGFYYHDRNEKGDPVYTQWSPILNFPFGVDFPYANDPLFIHWKGTLHAPETGNYEFIADTQEYASVSVDGMTALPWNDGKNPSAPKVGTIHLTQGEHTIDVYFKKILGPTFSLLWKTPSMSSPKVIPTEAFGTTH